MNWGIEDLAAAAALLLSAGLAIAIVFRIARAGPARALLTGVVALVALAIWAHLAVGLL
jgi:hypothetical protein